MPAGDKIFWIGGFKNNKINDIKAETGAQVYLFHTGKTIYIIGNQKQTKEATKSINKLLNSISFVDLGRKMNVLLEGNDYLLSELEKEYGVEVLIQRNVGRMTIYGDEDNVVNAIERIEKELDKKIDGNVTSKPYKLIYNINKCDTVSDVVKWLKQGNLSINNEVISSVLNVVTSWRVKDSHKGLISNEEATPEEKLNIILKKNQDGIRIITDLFRGYSDIMTISDIGMLIYCWGLYDVKQVVSLTKTSNFDVWGKFIGLFIDKVEATKNISKHGGSISKVFATLIKIQPKYPEFNDHFNILNIWTHKVISSLSQHNLAYLIESLGYFMLSKHETGNNELSIKILNDKRISIWSILSDDIGNHYPQGFIHEYVADILNGIGNIISNYYDISNDQEIINSSILNLCNELYFRHDSMNIRHSFRIITSLSSLDFYDKNVFDLLLPQNALHLHHKKNNGQYTTNDAVNILNSLSKTRHINAFLTTKLADVINQNKTILNTFELIEAIWSILYLNHIYTETNDNYLINTDVMENLLNYFAFQIQHFNYDSIPNIISIKLLQINLLSQRLDAQYEVIPNSNEINDILQLELTSHQSNNQHNPTSFNHHDYKLKVLNCLNKTLFGKKQTNSDELMNTIPIDLITSNGLIIDICLNEKQKSGIIIYGPNTHFINNTSHIIGWKHLNTTLLREYFHWDILELHHSIHNDEATLSTEIQNWFGLKQEILI